MREKEEGKERGSYLEKKKRKEGGAEEEKRGRQEQEGKQLIQVELGYSHSRSAASQWPSGSGGGVQRPSAELPGHPGSALSGCFSDPQRP